MPDDKLIFNARGDFVHAYGRGDRTTLRVTGRPIGDDLHTLRGTVLRGVEMELDRESAEALIRQIAEVAGIEWEPASVDAPKDPLGQEIDPAAWARLRNVYPADMAPFSRTIPIERR